MKRKIIAILLACMLSASLSGCTGEAQAATSAKFQVLINSGSCFAYTFEDPETGVWYMVAGKGVTPRLNADGSIYTGE